MPGPSRWNRKTKARNDARKKPASRGGRTASERGLGRSMAAAGRKVSKSNLRGPKRKPVRAVRSPSIPKPLRSPQALDAIERLRTRAGASGRTLSQENLATNLEVSRNRDKAERELENAALRSMPTRGEALKAEDQVRANTRLNAEGTRVERLAGARQVGNERLGAVQRAAERGRIRREGDRFTTPRVRRVQRKVRRAKRQVRRARAAAQSGVEGPLTQGQKEFVREFSRRTGINPRVAGAWVLAEMSGGAATGREAEGNHNWLNIAYFDSGPGTITKDAVWGSPKSAAQASADFLKGKRFGPSAGIRAILPNARGRSDEAQIQAIAASDWASSGYDGGNLLRGTHDLISYTPPSRKAKRRLDQAKAKAETIDQEAARLGLPGTKGLPKDGKRAIQENFRIRKEKGEWAGSQALIQKILRAGPNLASDKEARGTNSYHDTGNLTAYAQDIPISGGLEAGEPVYDQALLDRVTRRIRRMGGEVPDLVMGMGYTTGYLQGYTLEIIPDSTSNWHGSGPHLHIGAKWTGEKPPPGTTLGGGSSVATGSVGPGGTSFPSVSPSAPGGKRGAKKKNQPDVLDQLRKLGFVVTPQGIRRTGIAASRRGSNTASSEGETLSALKKKYDLR